MSSRLELQPAELDRLEDALEELELSPELDPDRDRDDDDPVAQRLCEYRELLVLSREALPMEDVPAGLLDDVLAQARQAAEQATPAASVPWWSRLRMRVWLPTLAFAGSAALLLVMLLPRNDEPAREDEVASTAPGTPAAPADARMRADAADEDGDRRARLADAVMLEPADDPLGGVARGEGLAIGQREAPPVPEPEAAAEEAEPDADDLAEGRSTGKSGGVASKRASKPSAGAGAPGSKGIFDDEPTSPAPKASPKKDAPAVEPSRTQEQQEDKKEPADELWSEVLEGDRLRHAGSCGLANMRYEKARVSEQARVRARALAGRGLCEAAAGRAGAADKLFQQARAADPSVGPYIDLELGALDQAAADHPANAAEQHDDVKE